MNLLVTLDSNYVTPLLVMLKSLINVQPKTSFDIYVAHSALTETDFKRIRNAVAGSDSRVIPIPVSDKLFEGAPKKDRISKETYYRLFASEYLPAEVDRILYIDPDTLIRKDISEFYNVDFGDNLYAGAGHCNKFDNFINMARLGLSSRYTYINAGVLMINVKALREVLSTEHIFKCIDKYAHLLILADQDVLNIMYHKRMTVVDTMVYNLDERSRKRLYHQMGQEKAAQFIEDNTCIVHYNGKYKPWKPDYEGVLDKYYPMDVLEDVSKITVE